MIHSIKQMALTYEDLSNRRKDVERFVAKDFVEFVKVNTSKHNIIIEDDVMFVSTFLLII